MSTREVRAFRATTHSAHGPVVSRIRECRLAGAPIISEGNCHGTGRRVPHALHHSAPAARLWPVHGDRQLGPRPSAALGDARNASPPNTSGGDSRLDAWSYRLGAQSNGSKPNASMVLAGWGQRDSARARHRSKSLAPGSRRVVEVWSVAALAAPHAGPGRSLGHRRLHHAPDSGSGFSGGCSLNHCSRRRINRTESREEVIITALDTWRPGAAPSSAG